jgi:hypothetical protein
MSVPAQKQTKIIDMINAKNVKAVEAAKEAANFAAKSPAKTSDPLIDTIRTAMQVAGLEAIEVGGADQNGTITFRGTIAEAAEGQYLSFLFNPSAEVLVVRGSDKGLPSIPVQAEDLAALMTEAAVTYFATRLKSVVVTDVVTAAPVAAAPVTTKEKVVLAN